MKFKIGDKVRIKKSAYTDIAWMGLTQKELENNYTVISATPTPPNGKNLIEIRISGFAANLWESYFELATPTLFTLDVY